MYSQTLKLQGRTFATYIGSTHWLADNPGRQISTPSYGYGSSIWYCKRRLGTSRTYFNPPYFSVWFSNPVSLAPSLYSCIHIYIRTESLLVDGGRGFYSRLLVSHLSSTLPRKLANYETKGCVMAVCCLWLRLVTGD